METLDWANVTTLSTAKCYFDKYVTAWNLRDIHCQNFMIPRTLNDDPCLLNTEKCFSCKPKEDYEHLVNLVQRHTKCNVDSYLLKKGYVVSCRCDAPGGVHAELILYIDEKGKKRYEPT